MVTSQGFNALLKLVEEPPPHVKFVFATTEPEKVIGTIRSRTHHYPFRLVPPEALINYLEYLCEEENVQVGSGVLPLVVRAGGGSVRDTLSVMDQLMAGAGEGGVDYNLAATLLGYTPDSLLDDVVSAIAARDGASVFQIVDRIIESGHDPRRFVEDLLDRFRDLVVIGAARDHAEAIMRGIPGDQLQRMRSQSALFATADLSAAADTTNDALSEMTGATSPRLHLELLCARLLLISAPRAGHAGQQPAPEHKSAPEQPTPAPVSKPTAAQQSPEPERAAAPAPEPQRAAQRSPEREPEPERKPNPQPEPEPAVARTPERERVSQPERTPEPARTPEPERTPEPVQQSAPEPARASSGLDANMLRQRWPEVLETLSRLRRVTWVLVSQNAQVVDVTDTTVRLGFTTQALANTFANGPHVDYVREAIGQTLGANLTVEPVMGSGSGEANANAANSSARSANTQPRDSRPTSWDSPPPNAGATAPEWDPDPTPPQSSVQSQPHSETDPEARLAQPHRPWETAGTSSQIDENGEEIPDNVRHLPTATPGPVAAEFDESSEDDEILENSDSVGVPLVQRELGGEIIEEISDE